MSGRAVLPGPLPLVLAIRLLAGPKSRLLGSTARAGLLSIVLGTTALGLAMALLTGYREDLVRKLVGGNAAVLVYAAGDESAGRDPAPTIRPLAGVTAVEPVAFLEGVVTAGAHEAEVTVRAASGGGGLWSAPPERLVAAPDGAWGAVLGGELAERLAVGPGDTLRLTLLAFGGDGPRFVFRSLRVRGTFASGFSEFDRNWLVIGEAALQGALGEVPRAWEVRLEDPAAAPATAAALRERLGSGFLVLDWRELNRDLFAALELQRIALFLLLGLIVVVATFNVASTLVVLVRERRRDFGVLAAMGLAPRRLLATFVLAGALLGTAGASAGLALALAISALVTRFELLRFGPEMAEVYFLRSVPLRLALGDGAAIGALALGVTVLACWLPAWRAARLDPASALRFE
jgi:lipoprotein-releasing system permease protein